LGYVLVEGGHSENGKTFIWIRKVVKVEIFEVGEIKIRLKFMSKHFIIHGIFIGLYQKQKSEIPIRAPKVYDFNLILMKPISGVYTVYALWPV
jgi:hypothetical protein